MAKSQIVLYWQKRKDSNSNYTVIQDLMEHSEEEDSLKGQAAVCYPSVQFFKLCSHLDISKLIKFKKQAKLLTQLCAQYKDSCFHVQGN